MKNLKVYIAGKVSKESGFGTHYWRDGFCEQLAEKSGFSITNLDPIKEESHIYNHEEVFAKDCYLISQADLVIAYFSDDISVGGSQEVLIAKYLKKPVIGLAPAGGKFNHKNKELFGKTIEDYKDAFVYATCDIVCEDLDLVAASIKRVLELRPKDISLIDKAIGQYKSQND